MATLDDILDNGSTGTSAPKGSQEWHEQQQDGGSQETHAPKGSQQWSEQQGQQSTPPPAKGTQEWAEQHSGGNDTGTTSKAAAPSTPVAKTATGGEGATAVGGYEELFRKLNPYTPPTEEELAKERKKQKRDQIFAAIGDGISALSNLYFTTQGAPSMYTGKDTMSEKTKIRYDKLKKDREDNSVAYFNGLMKARMADKEDANNERAWQRQLGLDADKKEKDKKEMDLKERADARAAALHNLDVLLRNGKIGEQEAKERKAQIEADYAADVQESIIGKNKAAANASNASAENSRASAKEHRTKAASQNQFVAYDKNGKAHYFSSEDAANYFARQNGTYTEDTSTTTETTDEGKVNRKTGKPEVKTKKTTKPSGGHSQKPNRGGNNGNWAGSLKL